MQHIVIVGAGIVGAALAYELSKVADLQITLLEAQQPGQGATGAALGICMGVISSKTTGRSWNLRERSLNHYPGLIAELETLLDRPIPHNFQGILKLCKRDQDVQRWQRLAALRDRQGYRLKILTIDVLQQQFPWLATDNLTFAVYSADDLQVHPYALTTALIQAAQIQGVKFFSNTKVEQFTIERADSEVIKHCRAVHWQNGRVELDQLILTAGLGCTALTEQFQQPIDLCPVLGQALQVKLAESCQNQGYSTPDSDHPMPPVITGDDVNIVPLGDRDYWVGATVEFPNEQGHVQAETERLEYLWQQAIGLYPALEKAEILQTWSGLRPRPVNRSAPIIEELSGYDNVIVATGHYRNGVLLAPATAQVVRAMLLS